MLPVFLHGHRVQVPGELAPRLFMVLLVIRFLGKERIAEVALVLGLSDHVVLEVDAEVLELVRPLVAELHPEEDERRR